jgi:hypothetical protein
LASTHSPKAFLLAAEAAATAFVAKGFQPTNPALPVSAMPVAYRVVIQRQSRSDLLATPSTVEKNDGVGSTGDPVLLKPISGNPNQGLPLLGRKKAAANHPRTRIPFRHPVKRTRLFVESRYIRAFMKRQPPIWEATMRDLTYGEAIAAGGDRTSDGRDGHNLR